VAPGREEKARRAFQMRVKKFTMELQGVLRTWQHRAVQRHWSDPAEGIDWQLDLLASPRSVPSLAEPPGPDALEALERAERRAEEQLEEIAPSSDWWRQARTSSQTSGMRAWRTMSGAS
jgi:hypothetical protein